ncbi:ATP-binding protein [Halonotius pteroides]|uniref:ATP-binding protein n=1 Tax=Halonotius pteroides TaxID=268735 RepID=A0A3A6PXF6_9EURY|nr:ATP-binding protein [Halonotius pteroides]RJX47922.1 ATP-binding protein [Halonotius pteroides]
MSSESKSPSAATPINDRTLPADRQRIGFVGPEGAGKTTVATMVADRLSDRTDVATVGEAATFFEQPSASPENIGPLGVHWTVVDHSPGTDSLETAGDTLDTVFVVVTPEMLDRVAAYECVIDQLDADVFLVVNRFEERHRGRLRDFDGPELAEYFYEDSSVAAAVSDGTVPKLEERTMEAMLLESLQAERLDIAEAMAALERGRRSIVNVEVESDASALAVARSFRENGYATDFFRCNCRCHDGHVLARTRTPFESE